MESWEKSSLIKKELWNKVMACPECSTCALYQYRPNDKYDSRTPHVCFAKSYKSNAYKLRIGENTSDPCQAYCKSWNSGNGCYIATAVYGSYDCPQVWLLRRYRDKGLARCLLGRLFIRAYYVISPTLVKWFGNKKLFRNVWREMLDCKVRQLRNMGIEDTPYVDRTW